MQFALSSYSLHPLTDSGELTEKELIALTKQLGFAGIEFAEIHPPAGADKCAYAAELREEARRVGIPVTQYSVGADFLYGSGGDLQAEIERLRGEVDVAVALGAPSMRHDTAHGWRGDEAAYKGFDQALPRIIEGARAVTEYAAARGVKTMTENHGLFCQDSERVERIVTGVGHPNFGALVDMGNFLCADEDPVTAVGRMAKYAAYVHVKDFHFKSGSEDVPPDGFFKTRGGNWLRGAVLGHGIVPVRQCLQILRDAGYDGFVTLEFEGCEEPRRGCEWGLHTLQELTEALA